MARFASEKQRKAVMARIKRGSWQRRLIMGGGSAALAVGSVAAALGLLSRKGLPIKFRPLHFGPAGIRRAAEVAEVYKHNSPWAFMRYRLPEIIRQRSLMTMLVIKARRPASRIPATLYHGTTADRLDRILKEGLRPGTYFSDKRTAADYALDRAKRRGSRPVVIRIEAARLAPEKTQMLASLKRRGKAPVSIDIRFFGPRARRYKKSFSKRLSGSVVTGEILKLTPTDITSL